MPKKKRDGIPSQPVLYEATFNALQKLNGSGTNEEIRKQIITDLALPDEVVDLDHDGTVTQLEYDLKWARTGLKNAGILESSQRGVWAITSAFSGVKKIDGNTIRAERSKAPKKTPAKVPVCADNEESNDSLEVDQDWHKDLVTILSEMDPYGFERLTSRVLRECGFSNVVVTQKSGDNGIDGYGKIQLYGLVSFNVAFQCKRQKNPVSSEQIRNFRGSLNAVFEKGIFITTGTFSNAAEKEAEDSSKKPQIDLIDGEEFIQLLIDHNLGVSEKKTYIVDKEFFKRI